MYSLLTAFAFLLAPATHVAVAGDSVVITVALVNNATPQTVTIDSVGFYVDRTGCFSCPMTQTLVKQAGTTTARFAYPLSAWGPNATLGGAVKVRLAQVEAPVTAWSAYTTFAPGWSYTRTVPTPAVPDANAISVPAVGLN